MDKARKPEIYHRIVPNPEELIRESILGVVKTLYWSPADSIPNVQKINYTLEDIDGISAKSGSVPVINIFYSTRWVERAARDNDERVLYETEGVLYHELVHGFQLEPQGIGNYGNNRTFFAFIEGWPARCGTQRVFSGDEQATGRALDGWLPNDGFLSRLVGHKDKDFLKNLIAALRGNPWSFDGAIKHVLE